MEHNTPFLKGLLEYARQKVYPFHTPGHKGGRGIPDGMADLLRVALTADVSLMNELDDIHYPVGLLKESQQLAAKLYGADESFFSVNGTTGAIHAMIIGCLDSGDKLLLPRNAHRSVHAALVLSGIRPVYMHTGYDDDFAVIKQTDTISIENAFTENHDIRAILLTSPDYYGCCADIKKAADIAHANGAICMVDEAHGPHLGFSDVLPSSALLQGADIVTQSTHKIAGAMTQCSVLHAMNGNIDIERVRSAMSFLTTTSPNQILLASLDAAFGQLAKHGGQMAEAAAEKALYMRQQLKSLEWIRLFEPKMPHDITKVLMNFKNTAFTGFAVADVLRESKIAVELADIHNILYLVTYADDISAIDKNFEVLKTLDRKGEDANTHISPPVCANAFAMTPREVFYKKSEKVPLKNSAGRIASEEITFYPPGIPAILPGELISREIMEYCTGYYLIAGDKEEKYINVVKDEDR